MLLDNVLIIFVKFPEPGLVKTRLAEDMGKENAALLYRLFVEAILLRIDDENFHKFIFYTPADKRNRIRKWIGSNFKLYPQEGKDLGERLSKAFKFSFQRGAKRVLAIGTDSPTIDKSVICNAFEKLKDVQCVIGPSLDGGYYLIGLTFFCEEIFKEISWGTKKVFKQTINKLKKSKLKYSLLAESFDIDCYKDVLLLKQGLENYRINPRGLKHMLRVLNKLRLLKNPIISDYAD